MESNKNKGSSIGGIVFAGCMFIGAGIGLAIGEVQIGGAIGMGVGFLAMAAIYHHYRTRS